MGGGGNHRPFPWWNEHWLRVVLILPRARLGGVADAAAAAAQAPEWSGAADLIPLWGQSVRWILAIILRGDLREVIWYWLICLTVQHQPANPVNPLGFLPRRLTRRMGHLCCNQNQMVYLKPNKHKESYSLVLGDLLLNNRSALNLDISSLTESLLFLHQT